ncbi:MAG: AGE family epimerase/isomerase [Candidatus Azobacteroides sp.]|nr:AGE family epimerase/isomerase [Candidatus Azobacteroides sp.]
MENLKLELHKELVEDILPYWMEKTADHENGGFYGRIDGMEQVHKQANKGAVMNARILWTFSAAYRILKDPQYLAMAERAFRYLLDHFVDKEEGGIYWELDYRGNSVNTRKQIYAQGFALYGFSEFYRASGQTKALEESIRIFNLIEKQAYDPRFGGYVEALDRYWQPIDDMRLSAHDANAPKSMNTHLHILEPYTNLLRVWKNPDLIKAQTQLIRNFCQNIVNPKTKHLDLFFDWEWRSQFDIVSYGHDIEAAWLLYEAAQTLGNPEWIEMVQPLSIEIVEAAYEGLQPDGSMIYEKTSEGYDRDRHWWIQGETVVGSSYAYLISGNPKYLTIAKNCWKYIQRHILDKKNGEWVWSAYPDGRQNHTDDKAGFWKCPYHNARMCMEVLSL